MSGAASAAQIVRNTDGVSDLKTEKGSHTFSLDVQSSYTEIQNIQSNNLCIPKWHDKCFLNVDYEIVRFKNSGVEIHLKQSLAHKSWITIIVNPSSLLAGEYCPTALFNDVKEIHKIKEKLREILDECGIPVKLKDFNLNRTDLTRNEYCDNTEEVDEQLGIFQKSYLIPHYKPIPFEKFMNDDGTYEDANEHSWTIACGDKKNCKTVSSEFSVYDKGYELKKRHGIEIENHILRKELRLGRSRIRQLTKTFSWEKQLADLIEQQDKLMDKFLHRLHQDCGKIVTIELALQMIEESSFRQKTKKKMRRVVKLAAKCESLVEVRKKMTVSHKHFKALLDRFRKLGISPITKDE